MEYLENELNKYIKKSSLKGKDLTNLYSIYPFNKFEYIISHLLAEKIIDINNYYEIRENYTTRNKYLHLFEISAPRQFGETWAQNHITELCQELQRPSKKLDKNYSGEYDLWYNGIKIEVKASRVVDFDSDEPLYVKALDSKTKLKFNMNFQQIKVKCCDVFIWIIVYRDVIKYLFLISKEVKENKYYNKGQHRGNVDEGQLHITNENIGEFKKYEIKASDIEIKLKNFKSY